MSEPVEPACDLVVVGGGLVGASLACALDGTGLRTAVIEPRPPDGGAEGAGADRDLALAYGTRRILERIGVWPALASRAAPVRAVRVSERGRFGSVCLDAGELGLEALGYVASSADLAAALSARLRETQGVTLYNPARLTGLDVAPETVTVRLEGESAPAVLH
ncbi:MAG: 2-octaprenyl-6-methoxyphenyl hydroxylase, partial [Gammaproteobacteria bacterium]|nr:2-octaprenyl-6-methoxyphenyl hydroxylase [Gammaproteobacteria bacterium]